MIASNADANVSHKMKIWEFMTTNFPSAQYIVYVVFGEASISHARAFDYSEIDFDSLDPSSRAEILLKPN